MHRGKVYPWLDDLWAVETTWWPYWVPRKFFVFFDQPQTQAQWAFITITDQVTTTGVVSPDRKSVQYDLAGEAGVWSGELFVFNQSPGPPNPTRFLLRIHRPLILPVTNRAQLPTYSGPLTVPQWQQSDVVPPWYDGTPLDGGCRCAVWSEV